MKDKTPFIFKCDSIGYRKGFIEITPNIHPGNVNVETWLIHPHMDISDAKWVDEESLSDSRVTGNTEIELPAELATAVAEALLLAASKVKN